MAPRKEGLRPLKPKSKPERPPPKSNAQKCREYKERIKQDPAAYELFKLKKKDQQSRHKELMTPEQKEIEREKARLRQQKRRAKLKNQTPPAKSAKSAQPRLENPYQTRERSQKKADIKEKNRLRQQKRRAGLTPQKRRRINEKRRAQYHANKQRNNHNDTKSVVSKTKVKIASLLRGIHRTLKARRTKLDLFKMDFIKKILSRQNADKTSLDFYKPKPKNSFCVEAFLGKAAVDFPGQRGSSRPKKVLTKPMFELYKEFKAAHPSVNLSLTTFKRRRPKDILLSNSSKFIQCLCKTCVNAFLLVECVNPLLVRNERNGELQDAFKIKSVDDLVNRTLCERDTRQCWERNCEYCCVESFMEKMRKTLSPNLQEVRKWSRWEKTERSPKDLVFKENSVGQILVLLEKDLEGLAMHLKTASWQRKQYQHLREKLPQQHVMCTVDFAENYLCKFQNEVQSAHWAYRQLTIHPCVYFYRCLKPNCHKTLTEYVIYISDDMKHDNFFTRHVIDQCLKENVERGMTAFHLFSDGCSAQYKSRFTFKDLSELQEKHTRIQVNRHYFGASHGKSLCDSSGGTIKNAASRAVVSGSHIIQSADDMFMFCTQKLTVTDTSSDECCHPEFIRSFRLIRKTDIVRETRSAPNLVKGIRSIHFLRPVKKNFIRVKNLSCFCNMCLLGEQDRCDHEEFTLDWKDINLSKFCKSKRSQPRSQSPSFAPVPYSAEVSETGESEVEATGIIHILSTSTNREDFFQNLLEGFSMCSSFDELHDLIKSVHPLLQDYILPDIINRTVVEVGCVDSIAMNYVPRALKNKLFPVVTTADGNCVPRALSILCFGNQQHHFEIRCRIVIELVSNSLDYLCLDRDELNFLYEQSPFCSSSIKETFQLEILNICKASTTMGLWQFMAAANVFGVTIVSVYPEFGPAHIQRALNCSLSPRQTTEETPVKFFLLWSATEAHSDRMPKQYWTANHVVPLLQFFHEVSSVSVE